LATKQDSKVASTRRKTTAKPAAKAARRSNDSAAPESPRGTSKPRWARSQATRAEILDATIDCFVEIGYVRTTTTEIAKKAGFTRGAVQYYFPTTQHVLEASVKYLTEKWLDQYMSATRNAPPGADYIDYAVETLWRFVNDKLFVAWQELTAAARTDAELRKIVRPAAARFEKLRRDMSRDNFPDFHQASVEKFQRNRDNLRFVLEGMSSTILTYDKKQRIDDQLQWLKEWFHASWQEELQSNTVKHHQAE
jgi:AcrR family transcriptional regulator